MKENNLQKKPNSAREYANLFLLDENGKKKDFSNVNSVCLITIGYAETTWILLEEFAGKDITIIDRKSEIDFIEALIKLHKLNDIRIVRKEVEADEEVLSTILKLNMSMFDLILANPPYGKSSSLSKKIVNSLLENKVAKEMVVLAPPKTFYGVLGYSKELKCVSSYLNKTCVFEDAAVETLFLDHIVLEKQNKYKEPSDFLLDEKHKVFRNAVIEYNKTHSNNVKLFGGNGVQKYEKSKYLGFEDSLLFEIPIYTPSPLNGVARQGESYEHNVLKKPIDWESREKGRGPGLLYFVNSFEYSNFSNWWYSAKRRREGGLINFMLDILFILYGGDPSLLKYVEVIPNVDWSRPWTDQEILKEIGLPEDFLGE